VHQPQPTAEQRAAWPVVLVSMPFLEVYRPSIQIALLKAIGVAQGFPVRTLHAHLDLAATVGVDVYQQLSEQRGQLLGEWLFSVEAFGAAAPDPDARHAADLAGTMGAGTMGADLRERLVRIRRETVPAYLDALVDGYDWAAVRVVGFSSTFQQNTASFALARRLKRRWPHLLTLFGGANFEGEMGLEYVRAVDSVDLAVIGEGDTAFPMLLEALATGSDLGSVPGLARRVAGRVVATPAAPPMEQLDDLPFPDYAEYFDRAQAVGLLTAADRQEVGIPFESGRGCWWGAKHHCTFCGLNGETMRFRSKSADRVLEELAHQARTHGSFRFDAVDNILDMRYLSTLVPRLTEYDFDVFYEVKANLSRARLRSLAQGGVRRLQPGIESLHSRVLALMRKGVSAAQNINLLRWAQYYGIRVEWNLLWGFPGETEEDYADQAATIVDLVHLQPPASAGHIWLERFSPLFTETGLASTRFRAPERSYGYAYPADVDLDRAAYFFEYSWEKPLPDAAYHGVRDAVAQWTAAWQAERRPTLTYRAAPGLLHIYDGRYAGREGTYTFRDTLAHIYIACTDRPVTAAAVHRGLPPGLPDDFVEQAFQQFQHRGLMFLDGTTGLALALPAVPGR
jgi:ribosomal peptide maturation radical SAM protein 1